MNGSDGIRPEPAALLRPCPEPLFYLRIAMLVLKRGVEEDIVIDGRIVVKVLQINSKTVRLGILAPSDTPIHRGEVWEALVDAFPLKAACHEVTQGERGA